MHITDIKVTEYIDSLYTPPNEFLAHLRQSAETENIPIILRETETLLSILLEINKPDRILEIGTAIGYSAISFATSLPSAQITTLELQERMRKRAMSNFKIAGVNDSIRLLQGDALKTLKDLCIDKAEPFDFIFIDGAKGHYLEIFEICMKLCHPGTIIVSDNILFKAMTASDEYLDKRRNKTIVNRMREYLNHITEMPGVITSVLPVGDGVAISVIKECK